MYGMAMATWSIYCHTHVASGRAYVGQTKRDVTRRWREHVREATVRQGKNCRHFWNAIRRYGPDAFSHQVLETCESASAANEAEERWIALLGTRERGFNLARGGADTPHPKKNPWDRPEYREKRLRLAKDYWQRPEYRARQLPRLMAAASTPEARQKMRETHNTPEYKTWRSRMSKATQAARKDEKSAERTALWRDPAYRQKVVPTLQANNARWIQRTHCSRGHEFTEANTRHGPRNQRTCRRCAADWALAKHHRGK